MCISPRASDDDLAMRSVLRRARDLTGLTLFIRMGDADQAIPLKQIEESFVFASSVERPGFRFSLACSSLFVTSGQPQLATDHQ
jgi:hypothetical protein